MGSIYDLSISLIVKWWRRLKLHLDSLRAKVIVVIHRLGGKPIDHLSRKSITGVWNNIANTTKDLSKFNHDFHAILYFSPNSLAPNDNRWSCPISPDGKYPVDVLRAIINHNPFLLNGSKLIWYKETPFNVFCFVWRASLGRIPSAISLVHHGVSLASTASGYCGNPSENADHILINCYFVVNIRSWIWQWCHNI